MTDTMTRAEWKALKPRTAKQEWRRNRPPRPPVDFKKVWTDFSSLIIGGIILVLAVVGIVIYATGTHYSAADGKYLADLHSSSVGAPVEAAQVAPAILLHTGHQWCSDLEAGSSFSGIENGSLLAGYPVNLSASIAADATYDLCPSYIGPYQAWIKAGQPGAYYNSGNTGNSGS